MKIYLIDTNEKIIEEFNIIFINIPNVFIKKIDLFSFLLETDVDCIATPGNSYGIMEGGFDLAIKDFFGNQIEEKVQNYIRMKFSGYLPVGSNFIINIPSTNISLIYAPTMELPQRIINSNDLIFKIISNVLKEAEKNNIKALVIPGFGGGTGMLTPLRIAIETKKAIVEFQGKKPANSINN